MGIGGLPLWMKCATMTPSYRHSTSLPTTSSASDSEAVSPGDSMPNRCTSRARPWSAGGLALPGELRADAGVIGHERSVGKARPIGPDGGVERRDAAGIDIEIVII